MCRFFFKFSPPLQDLHSFPTRRSSDLPFVPERGFRFGLSGLERPDKLLLLVHDPHPAPTPAGRRLDDHGKPDLASGFERLALAAELAGAAGKNRNSAAPQDLPRLRLVPEHRDVLGGRADELEPV